MNRPFISALAPMVGAVLLVGCGSGRTGLVPTRKLAQLQLNIPVSSQLAGKIAAAASKAGTGSQSRLIPSNATKLSVTYTTLDTNGALKSVTIAAGQVSTVLASFPFNSSPYPPSSWQAIIPDFAAGVDNVLTVSVTDGTNTIATGSATLNLAPGALADGTNPITITLSSVITDDPSNPKGNFLLDGVAVSSHSTNALSDSSIHSLNLASFTSAVSPFPNISVPGSKLTWSTDHPEALRLLQTTGNTIQFQQVKPGVTAQLNVTYTETTGDGKTSQTISHDYIKLSTALSLGTPQTLALKDSSSFSITTANVYGLADAGYVWQYDTSLSLYESITQYVLPSTINTLVNLRTAGISQYGELGGNPQFNLAYFTYPAASSTSYWALVKWDGSEVKALKGNSTVFWTHAAAATIVSIDAKAQNVYLLENNAGSYQIEVLKTSDGSQVGVIPIPVGFSPTHLAVQTPPTTPVNGTATTFYLADASNVKALTVSNLFPTLTQVAAISNIVTIATAADPSQNKMDDRFVYVLTDTGLTVLPTDGTSTPILTQAISNARNLSAHFDSTTYSTSVYVLKDSGGATAASISKYLLP